MGRARGLLREILSPGRAKLGELQGAVERLEDLMRRHTQRRQANPEGDHAANGLAEVGVREVKAQTRVLKSHLEDGLKRQLDWSEPLATWLVRHSANCLSRYRIQADGNTPDQRRTGKRWRRQAVELGEKAAFLLVVARREGRVAGDAERMMDGIFAGHHERTGATLFLSERGLLRGTRVQRKTADQQWDNEFIRKCRGIPLMLNGKEPEVRTPPVPAVVMPAPEAIVRTPQQRRWYILKQNVARYGPTAGGAQRVTMPRTDECRALMDEPTERDEDALVQQRLHADRLWRGSTTAGSSGDERRDPDAEAVGSGLLAGSSGDAPRVGGAEGSTSTATEAAGSSGDASRAGRAEQPMRTAADDTDTRRGLKRSAVLPLDEGARDRAPVVENMLMMMRRLSRQLCSRCTRECGKDGKDFKGGCEDD